jgi:hypothetical protein
MESVATLSTGTKLPTFRMNAFLHINGQIVKSIHGLPDPGGECSTIETSRTISQLTRYDVPEDISLKILGFSGYRVPFSYCTLVPLSGYIHKGTGKTKIHPRRGHEGPDVEYRYKSTLSLTSALVGSGWSTPRPLNHPWKTRYPLYRRLGGPRGTVWTGAENLASHRDSISGPSSP